MKPFLFFLCLVCCVNGIGQVSLSGNAAVQPGATETYIASYQSWDWQMSDAVWYVVGGTIAFSDRYQCVVEWKNTNGTGYVYVSETWFGQYGSMEIQIGDAIPSVSPSYQTFSFGTAPGEISVVFNFTPTGSVTYQWQEWSTVQNNWINLAEYNPGFMPPALTQNKRYRCFVTVNGTVYENLESEVVIPPLAPGTLYSYSPATLAYNTSIGAVATYPASGGQCVSNAYGYTWEQSVENGPWLQIGTGEGPPPFSPIVGNTRIRRSVRCNDEVQYTNVLSFEASYLAVDFENRNYVRETTVARKGIRSWQEADQLAVGEKFQTTTYFDGLDRTIQTVDKEISSRNDNTWNDRVKHYAYDAAGRMLKDFIPYSSSSNPGKFKTDAEAEQKLSIQALYDEPPTALTYSLTETDGSPLNRTKKIIPPGRSWINSGASTDLDFNEISENVRIWTLDYATDATPYSPQAYTDGTLLRNTTVSEGKKLITYTDRNGNLILTKAQYKDAGTALTDQHDGWICTYNVYDDFGKLRYQLQPEAVKYLDEHGWTFSGTDGQTVLDELCLQYRYDAKGRNVWKKAPGTKPLIMLYDARNRVVFMQDGNQREKVPAEWTVSLYDELDRPVLTTLYRTAETITEILDGINNSPPVNQGVFISLYGPTVLTSIYQPPIPLERLDDPLVCTILKHQFYDNYAYPGAKPFDPNYDNTTAYSPSDDNVQPIVHSDRTTGFATGSITRILGTQDFLKSTTYYDNRGLPVQTSDDNIKSGLDVITVQYHFDGRVLSTHTKHTAAGTGYTQFGVLTKNNFDKIGRSKSIEKNWGGNGFKTIARYSYDEAGRLKTKRLSPDYTGSGKNELESLIYSYNINSLITGINKDYALKTPGAYDKWGNFFGLYLGYDNRDGVFDAADLSGKVTGLLWNTMGDDVQRRYDYTYDNAGRLTKAAFKQQQFVNDGWDDAKLNFSVTGEGFGETIKYDLNGNLLSMIHKGFLLTNSTPVEIDHLEYRYAPLSNRLVKVKEWSNIGNSNGLNGDFKDGYNSDDDYSYDKNGNLTLDLNKGEPGTASPGAHITYNHLDKPVEITVAGKGTVNIVYDANGTKLQKIVTPATGGMPVTTSYIKNFVYKGDDLQYIGFEEGRVRVMEPVSQSNDYDFINLSGNLNLPNGKQGALDYFIRDYQQNVRMILTEETHEGMSQCTMETGRAVFEEANFGQLGQQNEVLATRYATSDIPGQATGDGWTHPDIANSVSRLGKLAVKKVGPNVLLKVMADDQLTVSSLYYYKNPVVPAQNGSPASDVLNSLLQAITGSGGTSPSVKAATASITAGLNTSVPFSEAVSPYATDGTSDLPKAYLNVLFFNERFEFVQEGSGAVRVERAGNNTLPLLVQNIRAPKNGFCYLYLANESEEHVYFDNLKVLHRRGRIVEENHYYPYGLKIAALSGQKGGDIAEGQLSNANLYNDKELIEDADLNWYDYGFRHYDPQIGRFPQLDPLAFDYPYYTPYQYAGCEPIANVDLDGLEPLGKVLEPVLISTTARQATKDVEQSLFANLRSLDTYINAAGQSFLQAFNLNRPETINYLGEQWRYSSTQMDIYYTQKAPTYTSSAPPLRQLPAEKGSQNKVFWTLFKIQAPLVYNVINSPVVGAKTFGAGVGGYRRSEVTGLAGEATTHDDRTAGGISLLTSFMPAAGAEAKAAQTVTQVAPKRGITMLGHLVDNYAETAAKNGYKYFSVADGLYCKPANRLFLDQLKLRGDDIILSRPFDEVIPNSCLAWELDYLQDAFRLVNKNTLTPK